MNKEFIEYFESLDFASPGNTYDWFSLKIELKLPITDETINKLQYKESSFSPEELNALHYLAHEYIHFLQNITTHWGGPMLTDYALSLMKFGASSAEHEKIFSLPLDISKIASEIGGLFEGGNDLLKKIKGRTIANEGNIVFNSKNNFPDYNIVNTTNNEVLSISNGRITKDIGLLCIRENMAHIGSLLFLGFSDENIHETNVNSKHFCSSPKLLDKQPEYWLLFEYFFDNSNSYSNIGKGIYALCAEALTKLNPEKSIKRFFNWLKDNPPPLNSDLYKLVKEWAISPLENKYYNVGKNETLNHLTSLITLCQTHKVDHYMFECFEKLFIFAQNNILLHDGGRGLYFPNVDLGNKRTWFMFLYNLGSPLIRYKKNKPLLYGPTKKMEDELTFLLGLSKTLTLLQAKSEFDCPFREEYKICDVKYKSNNCMTQPYIVTNPAKDGSECIFSNCLKLLGLQGRISDQ
jgi:hypothetical protein